MSISRPIPLARLAHATRWLPRVIAVVLVLDLITYIVREWHSLAGAPAVFIVAFATALGAGYALASWHYKPTTNALNERIKLRDDQIVALKGKLEALSSDTKPAKSEATATELISKEETPPQPITALVATLERIENKMSPGPSEIYPPGRMVSVRSLTNEQRARVLAGIKGVSGGKISLTVQTVAYDGRQLGRDLRDVFAEAEWVVDFQTLPLLGFNESAPGLVLVVVDPGNLTDEQKAITRALHAAGLAFETRKVGGHMGYEAELRVMEKLS